MQKENKGSIDLTRGSIPGGILAFAIPLFLGQLLQQLYNMVDAWGITESGVPSHTRRWGARIRPATVPIAEAISPIRKFVWTAFETLSSSRAPK